MCTTGTRARWRRPSSPIRTSWAAANVCLLKLFQLRERLSSLPCCPAATKKRQRTRIKRRKRAKVNYSNFSPRKRKVRVPKNYSISFYSISFNQLHSINLNHSIFFNQSHLINLIQPISFNQSHFIQSYSTNLIQSILFKQSHFIQSHSIHII